MYVSVKGGEAAIDNAHAWLAETRRGDTAIPALSLAQIREQLGGSVDRVMTEGSLFDPELAALAIKQARGDLVEAIFLLRAYRTTLPRFGYSEPVDTATMQVRRRVSATFKDLPGGQLLGPTPDYSHRLLDFALAADDAAVPPAATAAPPAQPTVPRALDVLDRESLIERPGEQADEAAIGDLTREPVRFPADRSLRLQALARADEGFLLGMAYSGQRGHGRSHPFAGEIRHGHVTVSMTPAELGFSVDIGDIPVTECQMVHPFHGNRDCPPQFLLGYGLAFGQSERKTLSMALADRALRSGELGESVDGPVQDVEFMLSHADNIQASGFIEHLKLPHYVDFQSELDLLRELRKRHDDETGEER